MATIRTNENVVTLRLAIGETAIVEFQSEGVSVNLVDFPAGLPELLENLANRLFCRSGEKDYYDQQLIKQARRATWELRTIKHQHWLSQFEATSPSLERSNDDL